MCKNDYIKSVKFDYFQLLKIGMILNYNSLDFIIS